MTGMLSPARLLPAAGFALLCLMLFLDYAGAQTSTPAAPSIDSVTPGDTRLRVAWTAPTGETGITAYDVRHIETIEDETDDTKWTVVDDAWTSGVLEYTITGLDNGTQYDVQVRAVNSNGDGTWSATEVGTPALPAPTISPVRADDRAVVVSWSAPAGVTSGVEAYDVRYIATSSDETVDSNWTVEEAAWEDGDGSLTYAITGLTNGTGYDVQVRAVDDNDVNGAWSTTSSATPEDHGDNRADASIISTDARIWGTIDPTDDEDYFRFSVSGTADFWIYTLGDLDTVGELLESNGMLVESDDYGSVLPNPDNFFLWYKLEPGTYYVKVTGFGPTDEPYVLRVRQFTDTTSRSNAATLSLNGSASGTIDPEDDEDYFKLVLSETTEVAIRASGFPDTVGELQNSGGSLIAYNDDGYLPGGTRNFLIRESLPAGTYYLKVRSFSQRSDGPYTVYATAIIEPGSTTTDAQALNLRDAAGGIIDPAGDEDYFSLTLDETSFVIVGGVSEGISIRGELFDSNNFQAPVDSIHFADVFIFQGRLDAGTYYLKVTGKDGTETGRYTVRAIREGSYTYFINRCSNISGSSGINDPLYGCQWHLNNDDQFRNSAGQDIRVEEVWPTYTGDGINVAVVDDGMHYRHEDLAANVLTSFNHNYDPDQSDIYHYFEDHGTAVAGLIAAEDNSLGMRGVAPEATIYGYNYLVEQSDANEADAMSRNSTTTAISNNSWGPGDFGLPEHATRIWELAVKDGVTNGYDGKGVVYVWAAGNGADRDDRSNLDEYSSFFAVTAVCAVGHDDERSSYSEPGSNLWVCGPSSSGRAGQPRIATTDNGNRYRGSFGGTSAAAPIVSGVVALVREANNALTWRDIKLILAASARKNDPDNTGWEQGEQKYGSTTDRYNHNDEYGFGMVDAKAAVDLATGWTNVPDLREATSESTAINLSIPDFPSSGQPRTVSTSLTIDPYVEFIEFVEVDTDFSHSSFRDLEVELVSPSGAVSVLTTSADLEGSLTSAFRFGSARHVGENAAGEWTLRMRDLRRGSTGRLRSWGLTIYGHGSIPGAPDIDNVTPGGGTLTINWKEPTDTGETAISSYDLRYIRNDAADRSDDNWTLLTGVGTPSNRSYTITGLEGGVKYDYQIRANNASGHGPWSEAAGDEPTIVAPSAPSITNLTRGDRTLAAVWTAPSNTGGGTITAYDVRYIETSADETVDSNWTVRDNAWRSGDLRYVISRLTNATEYDVQVRAVSRGGDGPWSQTETGTPLPDDIPITMQWDDTTLDVGENAGSVVLTAFFTTTLNAPPEADFEFDLVVMTTDLGATRNDDYTPPPTSANFVAGDFGQVVVNGQQRYRATRNFTVAIIDDTADESDEDFRVTMNYLTPGLSHLREGPQSAVVTIRDNEHVPVTLSWDQSDVTVDEDDGTVTLHAYAVTTVDKRPENGFTFDASVYTSNGSASQPGDYTRLDDNLTFGRNDFSRVTINGQRRYRAAKQVVVDIEDDTVDEIQEAFTVTFEYSNPGAPHLQGGAAVASVKITDDEYVPVTIGWRDTEVSVSEDAGSVTLYVLSTTTEAGMPQSDFSFDVRVTTRSGSARQDSDYASLDATETFQHSDFSSTFINGELRYRAEKQVTIDILDDIHGESDEVFTLRVAYARSGLPYQQGSSAAATVTIKDDEGEDPVTSTRNPPSTYRENGTAAIYTFRATDPQGGPTTWTLEGTDRGDFTFTADNSGRGVLAFSAPPDFEAPADADRQNDYELTVTVTDQDNLSDSLSFTVTVTDIDEGPEIRRLGSPSGNVRENYDPSLVLARYAAADPEGNTVSNWRTSGTDGGDFVINEQGELRFRNMPDYESPADSNRDNTYVFTVQVSDGRIYGSFDETVMVTPVNEPPTITTVSSSATALRQDENRTSRLYTYRATDPERSTVSWSVGGTDRRFFTIDERGQFSFRGDSPPNFEQPSDSGGDNVYDVMIQATDDGSNTASLPVTVTVRDVNEPPEVTGSQDLPFDENQSIDRVLATYSATDPEDPFTLTTRWSTSGTDGGDFVINESGELTFRNVPDYERPADSNGDNVYSFSVRAYDGRLYGYLPVTVAVYDVNEPPTITTDSSSATALRQDENRTSRLYTYRATDPERRTITWSVTGADRNHFTIDERGQFSFSENGPPNFERPGDSGGNNVYDVTIQATDDASNTVSLPVTVTVIDVNEAPEISGQQELSFAENHTIDQVLATYNATDPEDPFAEITRWSLSGTDGGDFVINEQGELRFRNVPDYEGAADSGRDNVYSFSVRASDGRLYGYLPVTVTVTDVNEPPSITTTSRTDFTVRENGTAAIYTFRATDPERAEITWVLSGVDGNLFAIYEGNVTFKNFANFEEPEDSGRDNVYDVTVQARDDTRNTASLPITVTVTDVNEPPDVTGQQGLSFTENHATDSVLASYNAVDPENPSAEITRWSTSGTDGGDFTIDESGQLRFRSIPDYERPADSGKDNVYSFSVRASDGSLYGYLPVNVTVNDVNEPPTITTVSSSAMALSQDENRTSRLYTYRATDPERSTVTWSVVGVDRNFFTIDEQGQFSFSETSPPNFEQPGDSGGGNVYDVTIQVADDISGTDSLPVTVTVRDVNEPPDVAGQQSRSFTENQSTDRVLATYSATDPENPTALITRWSTSGTDGGDFTIDESGQLRFRNIPDYERPADSGKDNVYSLSVRASDGSLYGYLPVTVTVTDVNEPPTITTVSSSATTLRQDENRTSRLYTYRATDPERRTITWSVSGVDRNLFAIDEQGQFSFRETSPPNFERPSDSGGDNVYDVTIEARDDISSVDSLPVTVRVRDVNEPPDVTGQQGFSLAENQSTDRVLASYSAIDPENPSALITRWSTSGTDGGDFTIDESGQLRFRNVPDYERPADSGKDNVYSFSVRASDGRLYGYLPVTVTVNDVNEPPVITTVSTSAMALRQDENRTSRLYTYRATDPEGRSITWSVGGVDRNYFAIDEQGQFSFRETSPPNFEQPGDSGGDNVYDVTIQVADDISGTDSLPVTVRVRDVNEPPDVTGQQGLSFAENHATDRVLATYSATDPEDPSAEITRWSTSGTDGGDFTIDEQGQLRFRNVPDYERPADSGGDNVYNFSVRASDGRNYGYLPVTVTVTDVNEPPVITTTSRTDFTVRENVTATIYTFRATDPEGGTIEWLTAGADSSDFMIEDGALRFADPPNFEQPQGRGSDSNQYLVTIRARDAALNSGTLDVVVTVSDVNEGPEISRAGSAPGSVPENHDPSLVLARYTATDPEGATVSRWRTSGTDGGDFTINEDGELTLRNVPDYERPADSNGDNTYVFTVQVSDGHVYGSFDETVTVAPVNEAPTITTVSSLAMVLRQDENRTSRLYTYRATDPERSTITWSVGGVDRNHFTIDEQGQFSFSETSPPNFERPADSGGDNVYDVTVQVTDDGSNMASLPVTVTVRDVNEPPDVTGQQTLSFAENYATESVLATYSATDPEDTSALITRWSTSGTDGGDFTIDDSGELRFRNVPDYERPADSGRDNVYNFSVRASDGSLYGYLPVTVTVTDMNEPPTITTVSGSATALRQDENRTSRLYTYRATDPERSTIAWSVGGVDRNFFTIDEQGQFSFSETSPPNFEQPSDSGGDNVYDVTIEVRDDVRNTATLPVTVTVRDVNEPPDVSGQQNLSFAENQSTDRVLATYSATDPEDTSAQITRWSTSGTDGGDFTVNEQGELRFRNVPDYERPADSGRDNVYSFSVRASDGSLYGYLPVTVTVTDVNEPPFITTVSSSAMALRQDENRTSRLYTYRATDPERRTIAWSVVGVDRNFFTIDEQGQFSFSETNPPNFEQPSDSGRDNVYDVTIEVRDDISNTASLPVTVTVRDVNEPPEITGQQNLSFAENHATDRVLATYSATDPEDPSAEITRWSTSGTDGGDFTVNEQGELRFRNVPDYERPADSGKDNVYNFSVRASDGSLYGYLPVTVTVTDVNEPPVITTVSSSAMVLRQDENRTSRLYTYGATDPERSTIAWSVGGVDRNFFTIDEQGQFSFSETSPPNFEQPSDSGGDNVYDVTIEVRDDISNIDSLPVTVTVRDVNEPPEVTGQQGLSFSENQSTDRVLATYNATDPEDPSAQITRWSTSGTDGGDFTIDDSGQLRFRNVPDYERPADSGKDNVYSFSVRASDGSLYGYLPVTVTVNDVNEPPTITTNSRTDFIYRENGTAPIYTFRAADPEQRTMAWSTAGADGIDFAIEDGTLTFASPPNFERPLGSGPDNNQYLVIIEVRDDIRNTDTLSIAVSVTDVNEPPEVTGQQNQSFAENQSTDRVLATYNATDPEDPSAQITRWSTSGTDGGDFTVNEQGELRFRNIPDYERPADSGKDNVYNFSVRASDGSLYGYLPMTVTVTDVNEPPEITTVSSSAMVLRQDENRTSRLYTYRATDPERSTITWSVGGIDRNLFTIDEQGQFSFSETNPPNFERPSDSDGDNVYEVTIQATDDGSNTASLPVTVTVTDVNEGPEISGQQSLSFAENHATDRVLASYSATDPEDPSAVITRWSLSGTDGGDFVISEQGGLTFRGVPDHERPADSGRDNVYSFSVRASDGRLYGYLEVTVTVQAVNEPPSITGTDRFGYTENGTASLHTYRATDPERSSIEWSLSGADDDDFIIGATTGVLSFASPPDYESPTDSGTDNVYEVTVVARDDASNSGTLEVTVTVINVTDIRGTAQVGRTLSVDVSDIDAADGVTNPVFTYQWLRSDGTTETGIPGATGDAYALTDDDEGRSIRLRVTFFDDAGNERIVTTAPTSAVTPVPNTPSTGLPTISGTVRAGETLTADTSDIVDEDGLANVIFSYQWLAGDAEIQGATSSTYTLSDDDAGRAVRVRVRFTDDSRNEESLYSEPTAAATARPNSPATGAPMITGAAHVGQTLTADISGMEDTDGLDSAVFSYQWVAGDGSADSDIGGATSSAYMVSDIEMGKTIRVRVSFTDDRENLESLTSEPTAEVAGTTVWSATLTVGLEGGNLGYSTSTMVGALSQHEFTLDDSSHSVKLVAIGEDGLLSFGLDTALATAFTLHVGGLPFVSADASPLIGGDGHTYQWDGGRLGWNVGDEVTLILTTENRPATGLSAIIGTAQTGETLTSTSTGPVLPVPPIWTATLTPATLSDGYGYNNGGPGELTETSFELDGVTYTIEKVVTLGWMYIYVDGALMSGLAFEVNGGRFRLVDASVTDHDGETLYTWPDAGMNWNVGESVQMELYRE